MTTLEILQKELPVYIWELMIKYPLSDDIDPARYYVHDLFDLIRWNETTEPRIFWQELWCAYLWAFPAKPGIGKLERIFRKHGVPLEIPKSEITN